MTVYCALSIALYLDFSRIYICGVDNTYFKSVTVDGENRLFFENTHFYDERISKTPVSALDGANMGHFLDIQQKLFQDLYRFSGCSITNLDPESLVDAFPKHHKLDVYR